MVKGELKGYLSVKEITEEYNKSLSTIRRLVKTLKEDNPGVIRYEELNTGHKKVYVSIEYLNEYFNIKGSKTYSKDSHMNDLLIDSKDQVIKSMENIIKTLNDELEHKNKQIEGILQRQYETNVLLKSLQEEKLKLQQQTEENKKKKIGIWRRKN